MKPYSYIGKANHEKVLSNLKDRPKHHDPVTETLMQRYETMGWGFAFNPTSTVDEAWRAVSPRYPYQMVIVQRRLYVQCRGAGQWTAEPMSKLVFDEHHLLERESWHFTHHWFPSTEWSKWQSDIQNKLIALDMAGKPLPNSIKQLITLDFKWPKEVTEGRGAA